MSPTKPKTLKEPRKLMESRVAMVVDPGKPRESMKPIRPWKVALEAKEAKGTMEAKEGFFLYNIWCVLLKTFRDFIKQPPWLPGAASLGSSRTSEKRQQGTWSLLGSPGPMVQ